MSKLAKATLQQISGDAPGKEVGAPIPVQFNPTTLKLTLNNTVKTGEAKTDQAAQYTGTSSTTLALDLVFDTADEGTTDSPRSVLEKTKLVEAFLIPTGPPGQKQAPPRARFHWGPLIVDGIIDTLTIDLDHFAENGTPLRAKVSLSMKEQKPELQLLQRGPGANAAGGAPAGGGLGGSAGLSLGAVGSIGLGLGASAQIGLAIGGESAAGFAARVGLDAEAWRGLSFGDANPLSLSAGVQVGFSASLSVGGGVGASAGVSAGVSAPPKAAFGLTTSAGAAAGFAVAAGGGVAAAVATVRTAEHAARTAGEKRAFALPAPMVTPPRPGPPDQPRAALARTGLPPAWGDSPAAPPPPQVDVRAETFGRGIPLRPTVPTATDGDAPAVAERQKGCKCRGRCGCS